MPEPPVPAGPRDRKVSPAAVVSGTVRPALKVFLSHGTADRGPAALVQSQILALGISVYLAEHDPKPGTSIAAKVEQAVEDSDAVVVLITTDSANSAYLHHEVGIARAKGKPIIPIVDKRVDPSTLGILSEVERLEFDVQQPAEAMAKMSASLLPLVQAQLPTTDAQARPSTADARARLPTADVVATVVPERPDFETLALVAGLGLLVLFLVNSGGLGQ